MFETHLGPGRRFGDKTYLRPETAQGIFANFENVVESTRVKVPFGIAQIGKSFRNEINPRNFTFRSREFEQMELEFFCKPGTDDKWFEYWVEERKKWYLALGMTEGQAALPRDDEKLSHYSKATTDVEYLFPFGWGELEGIANRTDYDLRQHQIGMRSVGKWKGEELQDFQIVAEDPEWSTGKLSYFDDEEKRRYIPYVIEPSAGADRATLAFCATRTTRTSRAREERVVLRLHPRLAPVKAAVLPLVKKEGMPERARAIYEALKKRWPVMYDESAAIGKRYRRQDEAGTPLCITIDGDTLKDGTVTVRERDTMKQERVAEDRCAPTSRSASISVRLSAQVGQKGHKTFVTGDRPRGRQPGADAARARRGRTGAGPARLRYPRHRRARARAGERRPADSRLADGGAGRLRLALSTSPPLSPCVQATRTRSSRPTWWARAIY